MSELAIDKKWKKHSSIRYPDKNPVCMCMCVCVGGGCLGNEVTLRSGGSEETGKWSGEWHMCTDCGPQMHCT